jgi:hypothetical protein
MPKGRKQRKRYAAKLLFQFRVTREGTSSNRRVCEERIIVFKEASDRKALQHAKSKGRRAENAYRNIDGNSVAFEFVGVRDMIQLGLECDQDEVWYDIREMVNPMERRSQLIPRDHRLLAPQYRERRRNHFLRLIAPGFLSEIWNKEAGPRKLNKLHSADGKKRRG